MTIRDENIAMLKRMNPRHGWRKVITGKRVSASQVTLAGAPAGKFWVRWPDESREQTAVIGYYNTVNHVVWVGPNANGVLEFKEVAEETRQQFNASVVDAAQRPPKAAEINKDIIPNENLQQFRVHPFTTTDLTIVIEPGFYYAPDGALHITDITTQDLAGNVPAASGDFDTARWVKISLDPNDGSFTFTNGTASVAVTDIDLPALAAIAVPDGEIPLYGIKLRTGQTTFDDPKNQFYRLDTLTQSMPHVRVGAETTLQIASGVIDVGTTSNIIVQAQSSTSDDLDTVDGLIEGQEITLRAYAGHTITLKHGVDNLLLPDDVDFALSGNLEITLKGDGTNVRMVGGGGSGGGAISVTDGTTTVNPATAMEFASNFVVTDAGGGIAQVAGPSGGATIYAPFILWDKTISGSSAAFDTNDPDDTGRTISALTGYSKVVITGQLRSSVAATSDSAYMLFNNDSTLSNYRSQYDVGIGTTEDAGAGDSAVLANVPGASATAGDFNTFTTTILDPAGSTRKTQNTNYFSINNSTAPVSGNLGYTWENTAAITRIQIRTDNHATDLFAVGSRIIITGYREVSVGAADLDISSISPVTPVVGDYLVGGDVSNAENTFKATIEDVLELATYEMTSTATGNIDDLDIGDAPIVELRMNNASTATIRGLVGSGKGGQIVKIFSVGAGNVELAHQNAGSTAANRLINAVTGMNTPLAAGFGTATYVYDATTQRWRLQSHNQGAAIAYTPTWTSTGTNPTLGNSTLTGTYLISGNQISGRLDFTYGSSGVSSGTGVWLFSTPTAISVIGGGGSANDVGVAGYSVTIASNSSTTFSLSAYNTQVTGNNPFTWGSTDNIRLAWFGVAT